MRLHLSFRPPLGALAISCLLASVIVSTLLAEQAPQKPSEKPSAKVSAPSEPQDPTQIELLETRCRFEANGDSRKEVHTRAHINNELGVRQFARLNFDYNRSFQSIDIPLLRITHASGGTADILPSAITDNPNPAVVNAPAYQEVRVKSVRILGLEPGDTLEYRIVTATTHHPLAPDFWFQHTFDRTGMVLGEELTLELPPGRGYVVVSPETPAETMTGPGGGYTYHWQKKQEGAASRSSEEPRQKPDISASTFPTEVELSIRLANLFYSGAAPSSVVRAKAHELTEGSKDDEERLRMLYAFVSKSIATVDLPIGATGFRTRTPEDVLKSSVATSEDKATLLIAMVAGVASLQPTVCLALQHDSPPPFYSLPMEVRHVLLGVAEGVFGKPIWLDPAVEVAPFGMISSAYRGKTVFCLPKSELQRGFGLWERVPEEIPFVASQQVTVDGVLGEGGDLTAKVKYALRGDNELVLRVAFQQSPKEKWKELAQLLSISDGFRGRVTSVSAFDPYETKDPFTVEYEITQPRFVEWSKKPVRIPALLPQIGLPDPQAKPAPGVAVSPIELGTPLEVETHMTLHLPLGTRVSVPTGTSVQRDYAAFASEYSGKGQTLTASRHIHFLLRHVPAERAADYNAFLRAVQNDQAQDFTLDRQSQPATKR